MKNFGLDVSGPLTIERVDTLPSWSSMCIGRLLYDNLTNTYWIGGNEITDGELGWIQFGLNHKSVKVDHLNLDELLNNDALISAKSIPILYNSNITDIQSCIDLISGNLNIIKTGVYFNNNIIIKRHIGFTSDDIPFANSVGKFDVIIETIDDALNFLVDRTANSITLIQPNNFGDSIGSSAQTVQQALLDLDSYLGNLTADMVKALIPGTSVWSSTQSVLEMLSSNIENSSFVQLIGTPNDYGIINQILFTNGVDSLYYSDLYATSVICLYPGAQQTTVQGALQIIQSNLDTLNGGQLNLDASDISYDDSPSVGFHNVDDVLDYLIQTSFTSTNPPEAAQISTVNIGTTNNVQSALEFLQTKISQCYPSQNTCSVNITPISISSDAVVTLSNVNQDYLLMTHTYGGVTDVNVFITARLVVNASSQDQDLTVRINDLDILVIDKHLLYPGYTIVLSAKTTLIPNQHISVYAKTTAAGCNCVSITKYRMLIEPSL